MKATSPVAPRSTSSTALSCPVRTSSRSAARSVDRRTLNVGALFAPDSPLSAGGLSSASRVATGSPWRSLAPTYTATRVDSRLKYGSRPAQGRRRAPRARGWRSRRGMSGFVRGRRTRAVRRRGCSEDRRARTPSCRQPRRSSRQRPLVRCRRADASRRRCPRSTARRSRTASRTRDGRAPLARIASGSRPSRSSTSWKSSPERRTVTSGRASSQLEITIAGNPKADDAPAARTLDVRCRAGDDESPAVDDRDRVAQLLDRLHLMGAEDQRLAPVTQLEECVPHERRVDRIEAGERLVQERTSGSWRIAAMNCTFCWLPLLSCSAGRSA